MILFLVYAQSDHTNDSITKIITQIQNGDPELQNQFIGDYNPFIIKTVSKILGAKFIEIENCDEYSIGLIAFNEAVKCYDQSKNRNFFDFARQVMKRRIINYWSGNHQYLKEYLFTSIQNEDQEFLDKITKPSEDFTEKYETKEEVWLFKEKLAEFGISFRDLAAASPKHRDSRLMAIRIARLIAENDRLYQQMITRKILPMTDLLKLTDVNKRTLERNRKYIIAVVLILRSDLDTLKDYIK